MMKWVATAIRDAGRVCGREIELEEDYRGRGMSTDTFAVVGTFSAFSQCVAYAAREIADDDLAEGFLADMRDLRTDSMGREVVFY